MTEQDSSADAKEMPEYSIAEIMALLKINEPALRKLIKKAGIEIDETKNDPSETIRYEDFRILWFSRANRRDGRMLASMLIEESDSWYSRLINTKR